MNFNEKIKKLREENGLSAQHVADELGILLTSYQNVESGKTILGKSKLKILSNLFNVKIEELYADAEAYSPTINPKDVEIGKKIRYYRKMNGMTQVELAIKLGYSGSGPICSIEKGKKGMSKASLLRCCEVFNVHIMDLVSPPVDSQFYEDFLLIYTSKKKPSTYQVIMDLVATAADEIRPSRIFHGTQPLRT